MKPKNYGTKNMKHAEIQFQTLAIMIAAVILFIILLWAISGKLKGLIP